MRISADTCASSSISFSNCEFHSASGITPFSCLCSSACCSSARRRRTSAASSGFVDLGDHFRIQVGDARDAAVRPFGGRFPALAVAVVVEQRALGGQLAALLVVLLHRGAGRREHFEDRRAAVLVEVGRRFLHRLDEVLREHGRVFLRRRIGRGDDDAALRRQRFEERKAGFGGVDERDAALDAGEQVGPVLRGQVGADEVELRDVAVVGAVAEQDDEARSRPSPTSSSSR